MEESKETQENNQLPKEEQAAEKSKSNPMLFVGIAVAAVVVIGGFLLTRKQRDTIQESIQGTETEAQLPEESNESADEQIVEESSELLDEEEINIIEVEGGAYYFEPNEIRVKKGETVRIVFTNAGESHNFIIDELNVKTKVTQTGEKAEVEFTANEAGEYKFYCSVNNHRAMGMEGTLIVE